MIKKKVFGHKKEIHYYYYISNGLVKSETENKTLNYVIDFNSNIFFENSDHKHHIFNETYDNYETNFYGVDNNVSIKKLLVLLRSITKINKETLIHLNLYFSERNLCKPAENWHEYYKNYRYEIYLKSNITNESDYINGPFNDLHCVDKIKSKVLSSVEMINKEYASVSVPPGVYNCFLAPEVSATLIHETFGHYTEEDNFNKNIVYHDDEIVNSKVLFDIFDSGLSELNETNLPYCVKYDDFGDKCVPFNLVKNSIFNGSELRNRFSTKINYGTKFIGFNKSVLPRMRNVYLKSRTKFLETDKKPNNSYIHLELSGNACVINNDKVIIEIKRGYIVKNGIKIYKIQKCFIYDNFKNLINNILEINNDLTHYSTLCIKNKSEKFVGMSAPSLFLKAQIIENISFI